ncbi:MAG: hypothetical protein AAB209_11010, partial [Bacteroidota bacterium]
FRFLKDNDNDPNPFNTESGVLVHVSSRNLRLAIQPRISSKIRVGGTPIARPFETEIDDIYEATTFKRILA